MNKVLIFQIVQAQIIRPWLAKDQLVGLNTTLFYTISFLPAFNTNKPLVEFWTVLSMIPAWYDVTTSQDYKREETQE